MTPILTRMKTFRLKIQFRIFLLALLLCSFIAQPAGANLIEENKSDTAIKMLVFPKSLRVLENRENVKNGDSFSDPPAIEGIILTSSPLATFAFKPPLCLISSPLIKMFTKLKCLMSN